MAKQAGTAKKTGNKPRGKGSPHTAIEDRPAIIERICALYESQNSTIESCCESCGIGYRSFHLWCSENAEFAERYKKAKKWADNFWFEEVLRPKAMRASEVLLQVNEIIDEKTDDIVWQGIRVKDDEGNPMTKKTVTRSWQLPNATIAIFAMKGMFPDRFTPDETPKNITVTFTDDAKHGFAEPGEPETE
jgi:hypothetical protein